ncbi:hypothetical protein CgunFtcFv8_004150 [Champsocephalus gunnari]|uniref:Uncharacterized protein n=1 Tax=Champsocephalus gunnari TaxID=52237 RepID=A0AAN8E4M2_CHAGU|nr:hypothetical protein CgunFtcFv8_004150 [Champsocephalus gunnari]
MARGKINRYHLANVMNNMLYTFERNMWGALIGSTGFLPLKRLKINVFVPAHCKLHAIPHMPDGKRCAAWRNIQGGTKPEAEAQSKDFP